MAVATLNLPLPMLRELNRGEFSAYDANNNLWVWPVISEIASCQASTFSAFAAATMTVTGGPEVPGASSNTMNLIRVEWQDVHWFLKPYVATNAPNFIKTILTTSDAFVSSPYTVT